MGFLSDLYKEDTETEINGTSELRSVEDIFNEREEGVDRRTGEGFTGGVADVLAGTGGGVIRGLEMISKAAEWAIPEGSDLEEGARGSAEFLKSIREDNPDLFGESVASQQAREESTWQPRGWLHSGFESLGMLAPAAVTGTGIVGIGTQFWGGTAQERYDEAVENEKQGVGEKLSETEKIIYSNLSGAVEGGLEAVQSYFPFKIAKMLPKSAVSNLVRSAVKLPGNAALNAAKSVVKSVAAEIPMELTQEYLGQKLQYGYGQSETDPGWDDVKGVIGPTIIMSTVLGSMGHAAASSERKQLHDALTKDAVDPTTRLAAADAVYRRVAKEDQELADMWASQIKSSLAGNRPVAVPLDEEIRAKGPVTGSNEKLDEARDVLEVEIADLKARVAAEQPAAEQPAAEQPAAEQPAAEQPAAEQPDERGIIAPDIPKAEQTVESITRRINTAEQYIAKNPDSPGIEKAKENIATLKQERDAMVATVPGQQDTTRTVPGRKAPPAQIKAANTTLNEMGAELITEGKEKHWQLGDQRVEVQRPGDALTAVEVFKATESQPTAENIDRAANEAATSLENNVKQPTDAQISAGNYKKGHTGVNGLDITIENPKGSERSGVDPDGKPWSVNMPAHYGYVKRTEGADGEQVDVYIGDNAESDKVFIVDQLNITDGRFDEHKAIIGVTNLEAARSLYEKGFSDGKGADRVGAITEMTTDEFKSWVKGDTKTPVDTELSAKTKPVTSPEKSEQGETVVQRDQEHPTLQRVREDLGEDTVQQVEPTDEKAADVARQIAKRFKKKVIFFRGSDKARGFFRKDAPDTVFVNLDDSDVVLFTFGHELTHALKNDSPDLYLELFKVLYDHVNDFDTFYAEHNANRKAQGMSELSPVDVAEEFFADFTGEQFQDEAFWRKLAEHDKTLFDKVVELFNQILEQLGAKGQVTGEHFRELNKAQDALLKVLKEYEGVSAAEPTPASREQKLSTKDLTPPSKKGTVDEKKGEVDVRGKQQESSRGSFKAATGVVGAVPESIRRTQSDAQIQQAATPGDLSDVQREIVEQVKAEESGLLREQYPPMPETMFTNLWKQQGERRGGEHRVIFSGDKTTVRKAASAALNTSWLQYLERIQLHNRLFPNIAYTFRGTMVIDDEFHVIVDQPYVEKTRDIEQWQIDEELERSGFTKVPRPVHEDTLMEVAELGQMFINEKEGLIIWDAVPSNVIGLDNGGFAFIDVLIEKVEETKFSIKPLSALHNLTSENLIYADTLGGIPVPSIAIVTEDVPLTGYGDVTLIGTKELADPEKVPVFDADAYTVTFPSPEYKKARVKDADALVAQLQPFVEKYDRSGNITHELFDNALRGKPQDTIRSAENANAMMAWFISEQGLAPVRPALEDVPLREGVSATRPVRDALKGITTDEFYADETGWRKRLVEPVKQGIRELVGDKPELIEVYEQNLINTDEGELHYSSMDKIRGDQRNIGKRQIDQYKTQDRLKRRIKGKESEYAAWVQEKVLSVHGEPFVTVGRKKLPYTLSSIVDAMTAQRGAAVEETMTFGEGKTRAAAATQFDSLQQMRNVAEYDIADEGQVSEARAKAKELMEEYRDKVLDHYTVRRWDGEVDTWSGLDDSMRVLAYFAKNRLRRSASEVFKQGLRSNDFSGVPNNVVNLGIRAANAMLEAPVPYFEAKPQRAVGLSEFSGAVIPKKSSKDVKDTLSRNGIEYIVYGDRYDEKARAKAVKKLRSKLAKKGDETLFSVKQTPLGFYSGLSQAMDTTIFDQKKLTVPQLQNKIKKAVAAGKVKQDEIDAVGLNDYLELRKGDILTKGEVVQFIDQNGVQVDEVVRGEKQVAPMFDFDSDGYELEADEESGGVTLLREDDEIGTFHSVDAAHDAAREHYTEEVGYDVEDETKYGDYTLAGGENYREVLLTLPEKPAPPGEELTLAEAEDWITDRNAVEVRQDGRFVRNVSSGFGLNDFRAGGYTFHKYRVPEDKTFKSSHFDETNILAHMRLNDREVNGEKVLFIEEIQSDWSIEGRKRGFSLSYEEWVKSDDIHQVIPEKDLKERYERYLQEGSTITPAPFVTSSAWQNLILKRILRIAADGNYDRVAWISGEQTADRYSLDTKIQGVEYKPFYDTQFNELTGNEQQVKTDNYDITTRDLDGAEISGATGVFSLDEIGDTLGKEVAQRIKDGVGDKYGGVTTLKGDDLKIEAQWARNLYDRAIPQAMRKLTKEKVETVGISTSEVSEISSDVFDEQDVTEITREEAEDYRRQGVEFSGFHTEAGVGDNVYSDRDLNEYDYFWLEPHQAEMVGRDSRKVVGDDITTQQLSIPITDAVREKISAGQTLFSVKPAKVGEFETGKPVTFDYVHNLESATQIYGIPGKDAQFGRGYEPSGRYVTPMDTPAKNLPDNMISGVLTFNNPLVIENDSLQWKKALSDKYDGKTGKELSKALIAAGYDGVVTVDETHGTGEKYASETLDLTTFDEGVAKYSTRSAKDVIEEKFQTEAEAQDTFINRTVNFVQAFFDKDRRSDALDSMRTGLVDRYAPINKQLGEDIYKLHRMLNNSAATIGTFLQHGKMSWDNGAINVTTKNEGFVPWLKSLGEEGHKFLYWVAVNRANTLKKEDRENWFNQDDIDIVLKDAEDRGMVDQYAEWNERLQEFNKNVIDIAVESGLIGQEARERWMSDFYIPFYRVLDNQDTEDLFAQGPQASRKYITSGVKQLEGGEAMLGDPLENLMRNWSHLITESQRQMARSNAGELMLTLDMAKEMSTGSLVKILGVNSIFGVEGINNNGTINWVDFEGKTKEQVQQFVADHPGSRLIEKQVIRSTNKEGGNIMSFMRNGKPVYLQVEDIDLYMALTNVNIKAFDHGIITGSAFFKRLLTRGATFGASFRIANLIRDTIHTSVVSKSFLPVIDTGKGLVQVWRQSEDYIKLMASGGGFSQGWLNTADPTELRRAVNTITKNGKVIGKKRPVVLDTAAKALNFWEKLGHASEMAARTQLYTNLKDGGKTHLEAAFEARDLLDFALSGDNEFVRVMTAVTPFLNARIQGLDRMARGFQADRRGFLIKGGIVAAASLALWAKWRDDDRYKELEDFQKWQYHHFWIGDTHVQIPKAFEIGAIFSTLFESAAETMTDEEDFGYFLDMLAHTGVSTLAVSPPTVVAPLAELWANKSFFTGRDIESAWTQKLEPGARSNPWDSATLSLVGKELNISPKKMHTLLRGYTATIGTGLLTVADIFVESLNENVEPRKLLHEYAGMNRFVRTHERGTKYGTRYHEFSKEVQQTFNTINNYIVTGDVKSARELAAKTPDYQSRKKLVALVDKQLSNLRKQTKQIWLSKTMSPSVKRAKLQWIDNKKNEIYRRAYAQVKRIQK